MNEKILKLGKHLQSVRKERGLTLRSVEEKTGVSNAYLSQLENGKIRQPSPSILHKLAECYDEPYGKLLTLAGYPIPIQSVPKEPSYRMGNGLGDLTKEEEEKLREYLEFLRSKRR
jgi:transcriptional regulator with XRE-family HTH domain